MILATYALKNRDPTYRLTDSYSSSPYQIIVFLHDSNVILYCFLISAITGRPICGYATDFVLYSTINRQPRHVIEEILLPESKQPFPVCWAPEHRSLSGYIYPYSEQCQQTKVITLLSDHIAVVVTFKL